MKQFLMLLLVTVTSYPQTKSSHPILNSSDGTFMFRYSSSLVVCKPQYEKSPADGDLSNGLLESNIVGWESDSCGAYLPICPTNKITATETGPLHPRAVACIAYPNSVYQGTSFSGGAFSVSEVADASTESNCLQFDRFTTNPRTVHWESIGGVRFLANSGAEGGLGHGLSKDIYLTFHKGKCYDLEIRMAAVTSTPFDPETYKQMEFKGYTEVERQLRSILRSFHFLK